MEQEGADAAGDDRRDHRHDQPAGVAIGAAALQSQEGPRGHQHQDVGDGVERLGVEAAAGALAIGVERPAEARHRLGDEGGADGSHRRRPYFEAAAVSALGMPSAPM